MRAQTWVDARNPSGQHSNWELHEGMLLFQHPASPSFLRTLRLRGPSCANFSISQVASFLQSIV